MPGVSSADAYQYARFSLTPGGYSLKATLAGFAERLQERVDVGSGTLLPLRVSLRVAGVSETTGGADIQSPTAGAQLNMVLKSGSNTATGSTRVFLSNEALQATNLPPGLATLAGRTGKGNRIDQYADYGFEVGGPLLKDRWWTSARRRTCGCSGRRSQ